MLHVAVDLDLDDGPAPQQLASFPDDEELAGAADVCRQAEGPVLSDVDDLAEEAAHHGVARHVLVRKGDVAGDGDPLEGLDPTLRPALAGTGPAQPRQPLQLLGDGHLAVVSPHGGEELAAPHRHEADLGLHRPRDLVEAVGEGTGGAAQQGGAWQIEPVEGLNDLRYFGVHDGSRQWGLAVPRHDGRLGG